MSLQKAVLSFSVVWNFSRTLFSTFSLERFSQYEVRPLISFSLSANWSWGEKEMIIIIFHHIPSLYPSRAGSYSLISLNLSLLFFWCFKIILLFLFCHSAVCRNLDPWWGTEPACPAVVMQSPSHWTAREVPELLVIFYECASLLKLLSWLLWNGTNTVIL